jgi:predicted RNA-binding Zn ribbon-like protein
MSGPPLCLAFANTVSDYFAGERRDRLDGYAALATFAEEAGAIEARQARALRRLADRSPAEAASALARAKTLREAIFRIFHDLGHGAQADDRDVATLNDFLAAALGHRRLARAPGGYGLRFEVVEDLEAPLWPIAASAAELLVSAGRERVRVCGAEEAGCTWLFVDESKNRSRRWCSMSECGNRAKARRHRTRAVSARAP